MKTHKIGELILGKFTTEIFASETVKKEMKSKKISLSTLIPTAWVWYDSELLDLIDENGDGKADEKFGNSFQIIYFNKKENMKELEQTALGFSKTTIKDLNLKYAILKCQQ